MKIFTIGASGMVGSRITDVLKDKHTFDDLSISNGVDITNPQSLDIIKNDTTHDTVIHLAAKADVDGCETDKPLGVDGAAYKINVVGTKNVVEACKASNKKLVYISTDFVFDGENAPQDGYTEEDIPNPINWYAKTKYEGEEFVKTSSIPYLIVRIAFPYRKDFPEKKDFVRAIADRLKNNLPITAITDQYITPTYIDDIAYALDSLLTQNKTGIYHVVGSQSLTPYDAAMVIAKTFGCDTNLISQTTGDAFFKGRAPRPFNLSLNNDKIKQLGVEMHTFEEGMKELV